MKFGPVSLADANGAILAHSVVVGGRRLRKGITLDADDIAALAEADCREVVVARLEPDDLPENAAASRLARALVPNPTLAGLRLTEPFTGRVNIFAEEPGVMHLDVAALHQFNSVHPMITLATVQPWQQVKSSTMVATIKVISYAVPKADVERAMASTHDTLRLMRPVFRNAGLLITDIPGGPGNAKGQAATAARVEALGMEMAEILTVPHDTANLSSALTRVRGEIIMILTGSATSDYDDVAPLAVRQAGGTVERFGMPVDPGNLLFLGRLGTRPVIGLPGCARSPALNGADWVLSRVACGVNITGSDISAMGVGGLLKEIPTRPLPRTSRPSASGNGT